MNYTIDIQHASSSKIPVSDDQLTVWATLALASTVAEGELTIRLVDSDEITELNTTYRQQTKATNVLAFPFETPKNIVLENPFFGDIIICSSVLETECMDLNKPLIEHWAHIVIHGVLHLLGHDHMEELEKQVMQDIEITLLAKLGYANPYNSEDIDLEQQK